VPPGARAYHKASGSYGTRQRAPNLELAHVPYADTQPVRFSRDERKAMPYDRLVDLLLLSQHYSTEIISDPERTLIYKDATYEAGTFEEIHALGGTHRRYCVNASYSNPMMGRIGLPAFVTTFADFRSNMDELYFGSDAPAIWSVLGEYEFRNRVVIAGGAVTMSCLPNTAAVANVYRSPGRTRLPVDVPNCAASDVDFFCLAYENEPLEQHKARVERL